MANALSRTAVAFVLTATAGCSTDSTPAATSDAAVTGAGGASAGGSSSTGGSSANGGQGGSHKDAAVSLGDAAHASADCVKYCTCMAQNCADKVFTGGCLSACAEGTSSAAAKPWDIPCRQNMCNLVPAMPNNDHCTHAFGTSQCD